jgi:adenylate cyclase
MFDEPYLTIDIGKVVSLAERTVWILGRHEANDIQIKDDSSSRRHAQIDITPRGTIITDLGSRNGTFVNKRRVINPTRLHNGDEIVIGHTTIKFTDPDLYGTVSESNDDYKTLIVHQRKLISILVVDIKGYTPLTQRTDETVLAQLISTWSSYCGDQVQFYGGWTHKFIGDAMMAVWVHDTPPVAKDIRKILFCLARICAFTSGLHHQFGVKSEIKIGAGINTGYGMVGNNGSSTNPDFTPIGDAVNAAFRFEGATRKLDAELVLGNTTYNYLSPEVDFQKYSLELKGYDDLKQVFGCTFAQLNQFLEFRSLKTK